MKAEILLAIVWTSLCVCERHQRSTVLTDEYKRVLEHFDFSNFDKQEALNYIDRQRYENQIRGKRSHSKFKRNHEKGGRFSDMTAKQKIYPRGIQITEALYPTFFQTCEKVNEPPQNHANECYHEMNVSEEKSIAPLRRFKRERHGKKKHKGKYSRNHGEVEDEEVAEEEEEEEDEDDAIKFRRRRKKKKKKKRKRRYWNHWSEWSSCSVTCGRGRKIRWRRCMIKNCKIGELEMGEKTCQLPACNLLTKLLGL